MRSGWLIALSCLLYCSSAAAYKNTLDNRPSEVAKRLEGPSRVVIDGAPVKAPQAAAQLAPGQAVYQKYCSVCHAQGIAGAPKIGDQNAWQKRLDQGWPTLMKHAIAGYKGMPAKGHCVKCSDHDIEESIEYMLEKSGINAEH